MEGELSSPRDEESWKERVKKKKSHHDKMLEGKLDGMVPIKPGAIRAVPLRVMKGIDE